MYPNAANAYARTSRNTGTPRGIEYQAFQRVTAQLVSAKTPETPFPALAEAIYANTKLWTVLEADLLSKRNEMADPLRGQLISLAEFARKHGMRVLKDGVDPTPLIDINTSIMRGLRGIPGDGPPADAEGIGKG